MMGNALVAIVVGMGIVMVSACKPPNVAGEPIEGTTTGSGEPPNVGGEPIEGTTTGSGENGSPAVALVSSDAGWCWRGESGGSHCSRGRQKCMQRFAEARAEGITCSEVKTLWCYQRKNDFSRTEDWVCSVTEEECVSVLRAVRNVAVLSADTKKNMADAKCRSYEGSPPQGFDRTP